MSWIFVTIMLGNFGICLLFVNTKLQIEGANDRILFKKKVKLNLIRQKYLCI